MPRKFYRKMAAVRPVGSDQAAGVRDMRSLPGNGDDTLASDAPPEAPEDVGDDAPSYRDLQATAKAAGLNAAGTREELEERIAKAKIT
jgi:hypothetical protein